MKVSHLHVTKAPFGTAVLFLVFNRPATTSRVFAAIRKLKPARLYVAADGPRNDREEDVELCTKVRQIATCVDWPCEVKTLFRNENIGCRKAVSEAIDWLFQNEPEGIILEDDCLPDPSFFRYAQELLTYYRGDERIMCISAQHFHGDAHKPLHSYFFSRYNHCWGWATWKRAWRHYDRNMAQWPELRNTKWLLDIGNGDRLFQLYWAHIFDRCYADKINSWAYRWTFSCWAQHALAILPSRNLVSNIGFGTDATHTKSDTQAMLPLEQMTFPLTHPVCMVLDGDADRWSDQHHFGIPPSNAKAIIQYGLRILSRLGALLRRRIRIKV